ncbi:MAG: DUF1573 domain-containing protein [Prevotella sp.]|nr:DUF1573 domain-containing protein [Prevotella sp.]
MKRTFIIATMLCLTALGTMAQKIIADDPVVNVGKTGYQVPVTATFELKNKGSRHLVIEDVKPDCGCTKVDFPRQGINAGEKFTITMTYDARMLGHFSKQAAVYSNGSREPFYLTMEGVVLAELKDYSKTYPYAFGDLLADVDNVEFDDVNKGEHPEMVISVVNNGDSVMTPNVLHLPSYLTAQAEPETLAPGRSGTITLTLNSENIHDFGLTQTTVYLASQLGEKVGSDIELPVSVVLLPNTLHFEGARKQYAPRLQLSADSVVLGRTGGKMLKQEAITLTNTGRLPLNISSLQMFTPGLKVTLDRRELQPQQTARLKVAIADRAALLKARQRPRVLMITSDPDHAKVIIKVGVK